MSIALCEEKSTWNRAVLQLQGTLYHSWGWGEVRKAEGWIPWRVLAENDGRASAAIQILEKRLPIGLGCLLCAPRGIAATEGNLSVVNELISWMRGFVLQRGGILLRMDPEFPDEDCLKKSALTSSGLRSLPDQWSFWNFPRATMVVDISSSEEEILRRMRRTHRQMIQSALKNGVEIETGTVITHLRDFYPLVVKSSQRQGFILHGPEHFRNICDLILAEGGGSFFITRRNGKATAAILCAYFGDTCHYLHGGFDSEIRQPGATEVLHWRAIQWAKGRGCQRYDLLGSGTAYPPQEGRRGYGLYNYKKGFGANLNYSAGYFDLVQKELSYRLLRFAEQHPRLMHAAIKVRSFF